MPSEYFKTLEGISKKRYIDKIRMCDGIDPYTLNLSKLSKDPSDCPKVEYFGMVSYLIESVSPFTLESFKAVKSLEAYKFFHSGWVQGIYLKPIPTRNLTIVLGLVHHSMRLNEKDLQPWVLCTNEGEILCGNCTCKAGLGEVCSHVAAVLFAVEYTVRMANPLSVTEIAAVWPVPPVKKLQMMRLSEMDFNPYSDLNKSTSSNVSITFESSPSNLVQQQKVLQEEDVQDMLLEMENAGCRSALASIKTPFCGTYGGEVSSVVVEVDDDEVVADEVVAEAVADEIEDEFQGECEIDFVEYTLSFLFHTSHEHKTLDELKQAAELVNLVISENDIKTIFHVTKEQSANPIWNSLRIGRITASIFKQVCRTSLKNPSLSLLKKICYPDKVAFSSPYTNYGKNNEKRAFDMFFENESTEHVNFTMSESGLVLNNKYIGFGASPDGIGHCDCHGSFVVEIKCPYRLKDGLPIEKLCDMSDPFLIRYNNELVVIEDHKYYFQCQMQMFLAEVDICYFIVWSPVEMLIRKLNSNKLFWEKNSIQAQKFFKSVVLPELLAKHYTKN